MCLLLLGFGLNINLGFFFFFFFLGFQNCYFTIIFDLSQISSLYLANEPQLVQEGSVLWFLSVG
jgi:hypothetical protein